MVETAEKLVGSTNQTFEQVTITISEYLHAIKVQDMPFEMAYHILSDENPNEGFRHMLGKYFGSTPDNTGMYHIDITSNELAHSTSIFMQSMLTNYQDGSSVRSLDTVVDTLELIPAESRIEILDDLVELISNDVQRTSIIPSSIDKILLNLNFDYKELRELRLDMEDDTYGLIAKKFFEKQQDLTSALKGFVEYVSMGIKQYRTPDKISYGSFFEYLETKHPTLLSSESKIVDFTQLTPDLIAEFAENKGAKDYIDRFGIPLGLDITGSKGNVIKIYYTQGDGVPRVKALKHQEELTSSNEGSFYLDLARAAFNANPTSELSTKMTGGVIHHFTNSH